MNQPLNTLVASAGNSSVASIRDQFPVLAKSGLVYLDSAATALMPECVITKVRNYDDTVRANVSRGIYDWAEQALVSFENARTSIANYLCTQPSKIAFTAGTTAGINLLANAIGATLSSTDLIVSSVVEHHSNLVPWQLAAKKSGARLELIGVDANGAPDVNQLASLGKHKPKIIAITAASNITGAPTNLATVRAFADIHSAILVVDGAQIAPHGKFNAPPTADYYAFSGHKCFGPNGVGILYAKDEFSSLAPPFGGGGAVTNVTETDCDWQLGVKAWEAGTPPISQAIGLGEACRWYAEVDSNAINAQLNSLTTRLLEGIEQIKRLRLIGAPANLPGRLPIVSFTVNDVHPHDICEILNRDGIAVRGGHQCAIPLVRKLGAPDGCVRASLGPYNNDTDIDKLLASLVTLQL